MNPIDHIQPAAESTANLDNVLLGLGDPRQWIRIQSLKCLGRIGGDEVVPLLALALSDRISYVAAAAASALANINSNRALQVLCDHFAADDLDRPHYLSHAIARFGAHGLTALLGFAESDSPTLRYFAARGLGETGAELALPVLERIALEDTASTRFGAQVATGAKHGLKTWQCVNAKSPWADWTSQLKTASY